MNGTPPESTGEPAPGTSRPRKTHPALWVVAAAAALSLLSLPFWYTADQDSHTELHHTMRKTMVFDFSSAENRTQIETLSLPLGELEGMDEVQVFLELDEAEVVRYPDTAVGSLHCSFEISINGDKWHSGHIGYAGLRGDPAHWSGGHDEVKHRHSDFTFPERPRDVATEHFTPSGDNHIEAWVICSSTVESTGPALVVVDFVLHAVVAMDGPGETYRPDPEPPQPLPTLQERRPSSTPEASTRTPPSP